MALVNRRSFINRSSVKEKGPFGPFFRHYSARIVLMVDLLRDKRALTKELDSGEFGVVALNGHQPDQHQEEYRWHQDRELEPKSFPAHVHEDPDNAASLRNRNGLINSFTTKMLNV